MLYVKACASQGTLSFLLPCLKVCFSLRLYEAYLSLADLTVPPLIWVLVDRYTEYVFRQQPVCPRSLQLKFPSHIATTTLQPDIIRLPTKQPVLLEQTVPWEDRLEEAFERKLTKAFSQLGIEGEKEKSHLQHIRIHRESFKVAMAQERRAMAESWVTWMRVYDAERPETPSDSRIITEDARLRRSVRPELGEVEEDLISEADREAQERREVEESVLTLLGLIATVLNLIVILVVYIYTAL
ncbi:hypothetical protein JZ751_010427 [Albula glossodonta]|uniref:Uncharacterized protein n=1 Tax=Albula glossodonta TaxID=121402 RepID=A0A8T2NZ70_9TELE|nr:hypothetical protein JZ751_010427 [Albula glossodonta]